MTVEFKVTLDDGFVRVLARLAERKGVDIHVLIGAYVGRGCLLDMLRVKMKDPIAESLILEFGGVGVEDIVKLADADGGFNGR